MNQLQKKKKPLILFLTIAIIILIGTGSLAYIYFFTDITKTNEELFYKYALSIISDDGFIDTKIDEYYNKQQTNIFENSGEISIDTGDMFESDKQMQEIVNNMDISFSGVIDNVSNDFTQDIEINYSKDISLPFNILKTDDMVGLQSDYIGSNYIVVDTANDIAYDDYGIIEAIKVIAEQTDNINTNTDVNNGEFFTSEELEYIKTTYLPIIQNSFSEENFSKVTNNGINEYTLQISIDVLENLMYNILIKLQEDTTILNKINTYLDDDNQISSSNIEEIILKYEENKLENTDTENIIIAITLNVINDNLNSINIQIGDYSSIIITKIEDQDSIDYSVEFNSVEDNNILTISLGIGYKGLTQLSSVTENYSAKIYYENSSVEDSNMEISLSYTNKVKFDTSSVIEELNEDNSLILNEKSKAEIDNLFTAISERIVLVNEVQMEELGITTNPLIYSLIMPITYVSLNNIQTQ